MRNHPTTKPVIPRKGTVVEEVDTRIHEMTRECEVIEKRCVLGSTGPNTPATMFPTLLGRGEDDLPATPLRPPTLCLHQVREDVIYARQVAFAFGLQPIENSRIEAHAYRHLPPDVPQSHHACQLLIGKAWDVFEIKTRFAFGRLALGGAAECPPLLLRPSPVPDIFGSHAFQPYGPI